MTLDMAKVRADVSIRGMDIGLFKGVWPLDGWNYRRPVTITEQSGNDLTDYQVLVELNSTNFNFAHAQSNGEDIRFTDEEGNLQDYWIEEWDSVNETAKVWVKVPSIPANGTTQLYMYYGNPSASSESDVSATFIRVIDGVVGSWHFDEGSGTTAYDSSGNDNDGTIYGAAWVDGKYGKALNFDGDDYVDCGSNINVDAVSVEAWVKVTTFEAWTRIVQRANADGKGFSLRSDFDQFIFQAKQYSDSYNARFHETHANDVWYHVVGVWDGDVSHPPKIYQNAIEGTDSVTDAAGDGGGTVLNIGRKANANANFFKGTIDEVRIYNRALSSEEISDLYNNYGYTTENYPGWVLVRKRTEPEPSVSIGAEEIP